MTPDLAKKQRAHQEVRLRAAELLEKAKQAKEVEAAQNTYMGFAGICGCIY